MDNHSVFYVIFTILFINNINSIDGQDRADRMPGLPPRRNDGFISQSNNMMRPPMAFNPSNTFAQFPMRSPGFAPMSFMANPLFNRGGRMQGFNPLARMYQNPYQQRNPNYFNSFGGMQQQQQQQREEIYSAIGYDKMDPNSQMRLTITERRSDMNRNPMMGGFSGMGFDDFDDYDAPTSWYVQGAFLGSQVRNRAGTYHLVLTTSGRTADGCVSESLGPIASPDMVDINNPFLQHTMSSSGILPNPVLIGKSGPTVYSSTLEGVSRRQLVGAGLAVCQYINNGVCGGYIPFCATIGKDVLPAMEVPMETRQSSAPTTFAFDPTGLQQGGFLDQPHAGGGNAGLLAFPVDNNNRPNILAKQEQQQASTNDVLGLLF